MEEKIPFAIFFDMDGTLLQTENIALPAVRDTFEQLKREGTIQGEIPSDKEIINVFGMTTEELWNKLLPDGSEETKHKANGVMLDFNIKRLRQKQGRLYPEVIQTLKSLREKGIPLFVVSNGMEEYIQAVCENANLLPLFTDLYSAGRFHTATKNDLVALLLKDYQIERAVMVGDRHSDVEAGRVNGLFTIACDFGFAKDGELDGADERIRRFSSIIPIIEKQKENRK
ncbi:HAD family hydrolase [Aneurinibacillus tyrosinisolvens]|uniref:HAD family hydrolase n=1 Tax=Aneurinibacillus tyrosinisolvens TaxID=1443435 RepID=UPI00063EF42F|nr:HAD-IA family hydrolase [Aneurinibacillus tyrosinisolvens]